jgi:hypothetical protein
LGVLVVLVGYYKDQFLSPQVLQSRLLLAVGVLVVQAVRVEPLEQIVFLALYLLRVVALVGVIHLLLVHLVVLAEADRLPNPLALATESLDKGFWGKVTQVDNLRMGLI